MCLPIIAAENWKPATKTEQVIQSLVSLVNDPEPEHPLRADLAGRKTTLLSLWSHVTLQRSFLKTRRSLLRMPRSSPRNTVRRDRLTKHLVIKQQQQQSVIQSYNTDFIIWSSILVNQYHVIIYFDTFLLGLTAY